MLNKGRTLLALFLVAGVTAGLLFLNLAPAVGSQITEESMGERIFNLEEGTYVYNLFVYPGVNNGMFLAPGSSVTFKARYGKYFRLEYIPLQDMASVAEMGYAFDVIFYDKDMKQLGICKGVLNGEIASIPHPAIDAPVGTTATTWEDFMYVKIVNKSSGNRDIKFYIYVPAE